MVCNHVSDCRRAGQPVGRLSGVHRWPSSTPFFIGLDLTARDALHDHMARPSPGLKMAALIASGSLLSWFLNRDAGQIAWRRSWPCRRSHNRRSFYHRLHHRPRWQKMNGSTRARPWTAPSPRRRFWLAAATLRRWASFRKESIWRGDSRGSSFSFSANGQRPFRTNHEIAQPPTPTCGPVYCPAGRCPGRQGHRRPGSADRRAEAEKRTPDPNQTRR